MIDVLILLAVVVYAVTGIAVYSLLEKRGVIPIKKHPFTKKKERKYLWDFLGIYFMLTSSVVFLVMGYVGIAVGLIVLAVLHAGALYLTKGHEWDLKEESFEIEFDDTDAEQFKAYLSTLDNKKVGIVKLPKKVVLYNDYLYISRRKKILIKEKIYKYIFMSSIEKKEKVFIIRYGFLGVPMFRTVIFIPKRKEKEMLNLLRKIENKRKSLTFSQKYIDVFKKK